MQIKISDYPLFIEPTTEVLELATGDVEQAKAWTPLCRIPAQLVFQTIVNVPAGGTNFFGTSKELTDVGFVLCYNSGGKFVGVLHRSQTGWDFTEIPSEVLGESVHLPSVRLVFTTDRARAGFMTYLNNVQRGKVVNPSLAVVLDKLDGPPVLLDVWRPTPGG